MEINTTQSPYTLPKTMPSKKLSLAVAQPTTGKTKLLDIVRRDANHIAVPFGFVRRDVVAGYPESELALVELFGESSQPRYLALTAFLLTDAIREK